MNYIFVSEIEILDSLGGAVTGDAESFLIEIETELEMGFITLEEAVQRINDFNRRGK